MRNRDSALTVLILGLGLLAGYAAGDEPRSGAPSLSETLLHPDGRRIFGRLVGDSQSGIRFESKQGASTTPLEPGTSIIFEGQGPPASAVIPPFRLELGLGRRISGRLSRIDEKTVTFLDSSAGPSLVVDRPGVRSVVQRLGEMQVLADSFESLDTNRWAITGDPETHEKVHLAGEKSLRLPGGSASVTNRLAEAVAAGRLEVAFYDTGKVAAGNQAFVDLLFRGPAGSETIRAVLGWEEESLSVESPGGPALAVQRLVRKPGWHRLSIRFGPEQTEIAVDGDDLAHGKGPGGPLSEIRLATHVNAKAEVLEGLAAFFDDLRLVRFADEVTGLEVDPTQDEIRLGGGDQLFGAIREANGEHVSFRVDNQDLNLPWSEVSGLTFRRQVKPGRPIQGLIVHVEWRAAPGNDSRDLDQAEGVLTSLTDTTATLSTAYASTPLTIARDRLRKLRVLSRGQRLVFDASPHHLGNEIVTSPVPLDPPQPEGKTFDLSFDLPAIPSRPAFLTLDVVQVVGESDGLPFSDKVKNGELRTNVQMNGKPLGYLNQHISSKNETPERIRLPIPAGLLQVGSNRLHLEQLGEAKDPESLDDLGILEIGVEFSEEDRAPSPLKP